jgi:hypothetical protein
VTGAAVRGLRNPFRSRTRAAVVVLLLALVTGCLGLMVQAALASRQEIARLDASSLTSEVNGIQVELTSKPREPRTKGETEYVARLADRAGKPVTAAQVALRGGMVDGMSVVAPLRPAGDAGIYRGRVLFTVEGRWELALRVNSFVGFTSPAKGRGPGAVAYRRGPGPADLDDQLHEAGQRGPGHRARIPGDPPEVGAKREEE